MTFLGFEIAFLDIMQLDTHFFPVLIRLNPPHCYVDHPNSRSGNATAD